MIAAVGPDGPLAVYLAAGMVATVNPCGFAMLPAYLGYFLGLDEDDDVAPGARLLRAARVALAVAAGFLVVFAAAGLLVELTSLPVYESMPWVSIVIGIGLAVLGVAMLFGFEPLVRLPKLDRGGRERTVGSMFVFGISYAVASIGCTLPTFLVAVSGTVRRESVVDGLAVFGVYALGMGLVLVALTVAIALARTSIVRFMRASRAYVGRVAGALVALAGAYVAYYGVQELRAYDDAGSVEGGGITDTVTGWSYDVQNWVADVGATRLALALAAGLAAVALAVRLGRLRRARAGLAAGADHPTGATKP